MIKFHTAILALALTTPFGLAIHDDLTREQADSALPQTFKNNEFGGLPNFCGMDQILLDQDKREQEAAEPGLSPAALRKLAGHERATLGEALAPLRFGMTADQARQAVPRIDRWAEPEDQLSKARVWLEYLGQGDTRLTSVHLKFRGKRQDAAKELSAMWGEPQLRGAGGADIWISEPVATRAVLRSEDAYVTIEVSQVMTLEQLLDQAGLGKHLLGAGIKELAASSGIWRDRIWIDPYFGEHAVAQLPGLAMDPDARSTTQVVMTLAKSKVHTVEITFGCGEQCGNAQEALQSRLGAAGFEIRDETAIIELNAEPGR